MLAASNISKSFHTADGELRVLSGFSLSVESGQIIALVGPSGCGKSTFIRLCAGLEVLDSGEVSIGASSGDGPATTVAFQDHGLLEWLTIEENVSLGVRLGGNREALKDLPDVIALVGLSGFERAYPDQLSGGMKSRASLARALLMNGSIALLDEPFRSLDEATRFAVGRDTARLLRERQQSALLVTHSVSEAVRLADRVIVVSSRPMNVVAEFDIVLPLQERQSIDSDAVERTVRDIRKLVFETVYA